MATVYKVLGQSNPAATTATTLYTCPSSTQAIFSTLNIANLAASAATFRVAIRPDGASLAAQHYLAYDVSIGANNSTALTLGGTMDAGDVVTVYSSNTNLSFTLFGSEIA
jgi:hypothetical protein